MTDTVGGEDPTHIIPTVLANATHLSGPVARPRRVHLIVSAPQQPMAIHDGVAIGHGPMTATRCVDANDGSESVGADAIGGENAGTASHSVRQATSRRSGRLAGKR